ncbi:MAG: O-antigen ligase family protein [Clostridia bacterium]|nr:O-antigen ligase family protein [Clostridia bacterium]
MKEFAQKVHRFALSDLSMLLIFLSVYACAVLDAPAVGICLMAIIASLYCVCDCDVVPLILPLLLIYCLSFLCPSAVFLVWLGIPCGAALVFCLWKNRHTMRPGRTFPGLLATSAAILLGGLGSISAEEYFAPSAVFIVLGLSVMLIAFYLLLRGSLARPRTYDVGDHVARAMYVCAVFAVFLILRVCITNPEILDGGMDGFVGRLEQLIVWRNGASNLAVICLPFIFYYARKHSAWHLLSAVLVYVIVACAGSRAALLLGALMVFVGFLYYAYNRPVLMGIFLTLSAVSLVLLFCFRGQVVYFVEEVLCFQLDRDYHDEARYKLFIRALEDFRHAPIFGRGMGYTGNDDIYPLLSVSDEAARWRVHWYHCLIPQIVGALGTFGILTYAYQFLLRLREFWTARRTAFVGVLAITYFGILAYSMLDPGIFSPMPFGILNVLVIALLEVQPRREQGKQILVK